MNLPNNGRRLPRFLMIAFVTAQLGSLVARADITYAVDTTITSANPTGNPLQTDTVDGSITTDGTIGVIASANITGWDLKLIDGLSAANDFELTTANSTVVEDTGSALSATATGLSYDYSVVGEFLIQANVPGPFSGFRYFCFSHGVFACADGETISPSLIFADGVVATGAAAPVGVQPLNQPPGAVPEPSSAVFLATAMLAVVFAARKRLAAGR